VLGRVCGVPPHRVSRYVGTDVREGGHDVTGGKLDTSRAYYMNRAAKKKKSFSKRANAAVRCCSLPIVRYDSLDRSWASKLKTTNTYTVSSDYSTSTIHPPAVRQQYIPGKRALNISSHQNPYAELRITKYRSALVVCSFSIGLDPIIHSSMPPFPFQLTYVQYISVLILTYESALPMYPLKLGPTLQFAKSLTASLAASHKSVCPVSLFSHNASPMAYGQSHLMLMLMFMSHSMRSCKAGICTTSSRRVGHTMKSTALICGIKSWFGDGRSHSGRV
jgi:hypothetical protein